MGLWGTVAAALIYMFPGNSLDCTPRCVERNTELASQRFDCNPADCVSGASHANQISGQLGAALLLSTSPAPFRNLVGHVVGGCSEEQMIDVYAGRIVASMESTLTVRDRPMNEFVGDPMGKKVPTLLCSRTNQPVSIGISAADPENATVLSCRPNVALESSCERNSPRCPIAGLGAKLSRIVCQNRRENLERGSADFTNPDKLTASHDGSFLRKDRCG
jgi:hypothetical protein